jgi:hypothetical protein
MRFLGNMGKQTNIQVIELTEFILSHEALSMQPERGASYRSNGPCFKQDFQKGVLNPYFNTFVAYQKGTLCGQSADGDVLFDKAERYYGGSGLAVFPVPESAEGLEEAIESGQGWFDKKPIIVQPETSETE